MNPARALKIEVGMAWNVSNSIPLWWWGVGSGRHQSYLWREDKARSGEAASALLQEINLLSLPCCRGLLWRQRSETDRKVWSQLINSCLYPIFYGKEISGRKEEDVCISWWKRWGGELLDVSCSHDDIFVTSANAKCHTELWILTIIFSLELGI